MAKHINYFFIVKDIVWNRKKCNEFVISITFTMKYWGCDFETAEISSRSVTFYADGSDQCISWDLH